MKKITYLLASIFLVSFMKIFKTITTMSVVSFFVVLSFVLPASGATVSSKTQRFPLFENKEVKVWRTVIAPHQPLSFHRHDQRRIVVPLTDIVLKKIYKDSTKTNKLEWGKGQAYWFEADPKDELHGDVNESDHNMEVIVIEFTKSPCSEVQEKVNPSP